VQLWLTRLGNPFVRALLRSPLHRLVSRALLLFTYTGRRTGRAHAIPVMYARDGDRLVVFAAWPERKRWWRNFEGSPGGVRVRERGRWVDGSAQVVRDPERVASARRVYLERFPKAGSAVENAVLVEVDAPNAGARGG
jgi:deazaflavin-dependent oxidoreductase (nitroreductase family)